MGARRCSLLAIAAAGCTMVVGGDPRLGDVDSGVDASDADSSVPPQTRIDASVADAGAGAVEASTSTCDVSGCYAAKDACKKVCAAAANACNAACNQDDSKTCKKLCQQQLSACNDACLSTCDLCVSGCAGPCSL